MDCQIWDIVIVWLEKNYKMQDSFVGFLGVTTKVFIYYSMEVNKIKTGKCSTRGNSQS